MLKYNYHTHTYRCRHANLKEEQAVLDAIRLGYKKLGFSEHLNIADFYNNNSWGSLELMKEYEEAILNLKEKYKNQIEIFLGYECEYYPQFEEPLRKLLNREEIDYLILGNHYNNEKFSVYYGADFTSKEFSVYLNNFKSAVDSKLFSYIAHPDLFMAGYRKWDEATKELSLKICQYSKENNIPLELNCGGIRKGRTYINGIYDYPLPYYRFWEIAKSVGNQIVVGVDAHTNKDFEHPEYRELDLMIKDLGLSIIEDFEIKKK